MTNYNVETCKEKKQQTIMEATKATQHNQKPQKTYSYACHIYGLNGRKMINYPKFIEMQKMLNGKSMTVVEVQLAIETQTVTTNVNVVDVNVMTRNKAIEEQVQGQRAKESNECC